MYTVYEWTFNVNKYKDSIIKTINYVTHNTWSFIKIFYDWLFLTCEIALYAKFFSQQILLFIGLNLDIPRYIYGH